MSDDVECFFVIMTMNPFSVILDVNVLLILIVPMCFVLFFLYATLGYDAI